MNKYFLLIFLFFFNFLNFTGAHTKYKKSRKEIKKIFYFYFFFNNLPNAIGKKISKNVFSFIISIVIVHLIQLHERNII